MNYDLRGPFRLASLHYAIHLPLKKGKELKDIGLRFTGDVGPPLPCSTRSPLKKGKELKEIGL